MYWTPGRRIVDSSWHDRDFAESRRAALEQELNAVAPGPGSTVPAPESLHVPMQRVPEEAQPSSTSPNPIPFQAFMEGALEARGVNDRTRLWYKSVLLRFAKTQGIEYLHQATPDTVKQFLESVRRTRSKATVSSYARVLALTLKEVAPKAITVCRGFKPYKTHKRARPYFYSPEDLAKLLEATEKLQQRKGRNRTFWRAFILLLYHTGLRRDEACHLQWDDIQGDVLHVRPKSTPIPWAPKSDKSRRTLPVPAVVLNVACCTGFTSPTREAAIPVVQRRHCSTLIWRQSDAAVVPGS